MLVLNIKVSDSYTDLSVRLEASLGYQLRLYNIKGKGLKDRIESVKKNIYKIGKIF